MASPQKENGFLKIANELVEAFARIDFNPSEMRIVLAILRKTYGWNKKFSIITIFEFLEITRLPKSTVLRNLSLLKERQIITIWREKGTRGNYYQIQKDYSRWHGIESPTHGTFESPTGETFEGNESPTFDNESPTHGTLKVPLPHRAYIENTIKDNKQKTPAFSFQELKDEINTFKNLGWEQQKIKDHFLMREVPEKDIDWAMKKLF